MGEEADASATAGGRCGSVVVEPFDESADVSDMENWEGREEDLDLASDSEDDEQDEFDVNEYADENLEDITLECISAPSRRSRKSSIFSFGSARKESTTEVDRDTEEPQRKTSLVKKKWRLGFEWALNQSRSQKQLEREIRRESRVSEDGNRPSALDPDACLRRRASSRKSVLQLDGFQPKVLNDKADVDESDGEEQDGEEQDKCTEQAAKTKALTSFQRYSAIRLSQSATLREHPSVVSSIQELWEIKDLQDATDEDGHLGKAPFVELLIKFQCLIVPPPVKLKKALSNAQVDWANDSEKWRILHPNCTVENSKLTREMFFDAIFQIADTWSEHADAAEYCMILKTLLSGVTKSEASSFGSNEKVLGHVRKFIKTMRIEYNPTFTDMAERKFEGFRRLQILSNSKAPKSSGVSTASAAQAIGKLYQGKLESDASRESKGQPKLRFDKYVLEAYVRQYGSKKFAKRNLKKLFVTVRREANRGNACMRMFAVLCGLEIEPSQNDTCVVEYDPHMASDYFLPTLERLLGDDLKQMGNMVAQTAKDAKEPLTTLSLTVQLVTADVCQRTPLASARFLSFGKVLKERAQCASAPAGCYSPKASKASKLKEASNACSISASAGLSAGSDGDKLSSGSKYASGKKIVSGKLISGKFKSLAAAGAGKGDGTGKAMRMSRMLSSALGAKGVAGGVAQRLFIDVHKAMMCSLPLWVADRQWAVLHEYILGAKAALKWIRFVRTRKGKPGKEISRNISILSTPNVDSGRIVLNDIFGIASLANATSIVQILSGKDLQGMLLSNANDNVMEDSENENDGSAESHPAEPCVKIENTDRWAQPSPRAKLAEAQATDRQFNGTPR